MSKEVEEYYRKHFAQFQHLTATDIEALQQYELGLQPLPVIFYKKCQLNAVCTNPHLFMQDALQNILRLHIN
ncbi:MAG: hypothetical protein KGZ74_13380 [Chitinophagaceae bacterium]|jgi:hypothetical protein|nr:hypothetical protein [Chitinophagaceae bacterium]